MIRIKPWYLLGLFVNTRLFNLVWSGVFGSVYWYFPFLLHILLIVNFERFSLQLISSLGICYEIFIALVDLFLKRWIWDRFALTHIIVDYVPYLLPVVSSQSGFPCKNHVPPTILFIILFYILKYLHPLSLPHILSSSFNYYFLNKSYQSQSHCTGFRALSWRMFVIDIENFDIITRSILPCSFLPRNLV